MVTYEKAIQQAYRFHLMPPPLRNASPIPKPMIIPPTTVTNNVSPSIIAGIPCMTTVPTANEAIPIIE